MEITKKFLFTLFIVLGFSFQLDGFHVFAEKLEKTVYIDVPSSYTLNNGNISIYKQDEGDRSPKNIDRMTIDSKNQLFLLDTSIIDDKQTYYVVINYTLTSSEGYRVSYIDMKTLDGQELISIDKLEWNNNLKMFYPDLEKTNNMGNGDYVTIALEHIRSSTLWYSKQDRLLTLPEFVKGAQYYSQENGKTYLLTKKGISDSEREGFTFEQEKEQSIELSILNEGNNFYNMNLVSKLFNPGPEISFTDSLFITPDQYELRLRVMEENGFGYKEEYFKSYYDITEDTTLFAPADIEISFNRLNYYSSPENRLYVSTQIIKGDFDTRPTTMRETLAVQVKKDGEVVGQGSSTFDENLYIENITLEPGTYTIEATLGAHSESSNFTVDADGKIEIQHSKGDNWDIRNKKYTDDVNKSWTIEFNKNISLSTVNNDNVYVMGDSGKIETNVTAGENNTIIVEAPVDGYEKGESYILNITNILSSSREPLSQPVKMIFEVEQDEIIEVDPKEKEYSALYDNELEMYRVKNLKMVEVNSPIQLNSSGVHIGNPEDLSLFETALDGRAKYFLLSVDERSIKERNNSFYSDIFHPNEVSSIHTLTYSSIRYEGLETERYVTIVFFDEDLVPIAYQEELVTLNRPKVSIGKDVKQLTDEEAEQLGLFVTYDASRQDLKYEIKTPSEILGERKYYSLYHSDEDETLEEVLNKTTVKLTELTISIDGNVNHTSTFGGAGYYPGNTKYCMIIVYDKDFNVKEYYKKAVIINE